MSAMQSFQRIVQLWNWLPAFRAVAETEHLPTAAENVHLTPSALSRSVRLLEQDLGRSLFRRVGRRLELSPAGEQLLQAVREAMQTIDDTVVALAEQEAPGLLRIATPNSFVAGCLLPVLEDVQAAHASVRPLLVPHGTAMEVSRALRNGDVDLVITSSPGDEEGIEAVQIGRMSHSVYCGESHPLVLEEEPTLESVLAYPFVGAARGVADHWPVELQRDVRMFVTQVDTAIQVCARGKLLAFVPDFFAQSWSGPGALHRIPVSVSGRTRIYAVRRRSSRERTGVEEVIMGLLRVFQDADERPRPSSIQIARVPRPSKPVGLYRPVLDSTADRG